MICLPTLFVLLLPGVAVAQLRPREILSVVGREARTLRRCYELRACPGPVLSSSYTTSTLSPPHPRAQV